MNIRLIAENLAQKDVYYNVSILIKELIELNVGKGEIIRLKPDYKASAIAAGWEIQEGTEYPSFFFLVNSGTNQIYNHEYEEVCCRADWQDVSENFYLPEEPEDTDELWWRLCNATSIELIEKEVEEYWLVSDFLADKLKDDNEPVFVIYDLTVWGRIAETKSISTDPAIEKIAKRIKEA